MSLEKGCLAVGYIFAFAYGFLAVVSLTGLMYIFSASPRTIPEHSYEGKLMPLRVFAVFNNNFISETLVLMLLLLVVALPFWYISVQFVRGVKTVSQT